MGSAAFLLRSETLPQQTSASREIDEAWGVVLDAAGIADTFARRHEHASLALGADGRLARVDAGHPDAVIAWRPQVGFELLLPPDDPRRAMIDLYLPICSATVVNPVTVGHLGQSLDGFIATHSGESQYVTGEENILHLHRMRALCDAVVVGAGTVAADDPQLTTRHVDGPNPLRVVLDALELESFFGFMLTQLRSVGVWVQSTGPPPALPGTSGACAGIDEAAPATVDAPNNNPAAIIEKRVFIGCSFFGSANAHVLHPADISAERL